jgi:hypothetical protein
MLRLAARVARNVSVVLEEECWGERAWSDDWKDGVGAERGEFG